MQLGVSGSSGDSPAPADVGLAGSTSAGQISAGFSEEGDRSSSGGNRWPREETLALLKIRSEMDAAFRDSSMKGPLWDEVSRKLAELGFKRSSKKCKEKFENVYKYHKRTKDGRVSKVDSGKTYRFFEQLEALDTHFSSAAPTATSAPTQPPPSIISAPPPVSTARTTSISSSNPPVTPPANPPVTATPTTNITNLNLPTHHQPTPPPPSNPTFFANFASLPSTTSSSSGEERPKRKRKWADFFQRVMDEVISKQEELQNKFLETLEKRERERFARDEAWRAQELARINREHDLLAQERSIAAAKDAAVIAFLQKVSDQQIPNAAQFQQQLQNIATPIPQPFPSPPRPPPQPLSQPPTNCLEKCKTENTANTAENSHSLVPSLGVSPSRWPKAEIEALIRLRTELDNKYHETAPKGPLWEEISSAMRNIGYNRNAKRCKEKWENINKYYRKVKESNKKRPESSKTCPYFHQLDALYKQKASNNVGGFGMNTTNLLMVTRENPNPTVPKMVQPEQQWPAMNQRSAMEVDQQEHDSENTDLNHEDDDEYDDDDDEEGEDEANGYEVVTNNKQGGVGGSSSVGTTAV